MASSVKNEVLSTLAIMGYNDNYIGRAIKIHNKSKFGTDYNLSLLVEIIDRLKQKDAKKGIKSLPFRAHFEAPQALITYLRNGANTIDFRFDNGRYILCKIIDRDLKYEHKILLHPASQPLHINKHNKYCFIYQDYTKLAIEKSVTLRKSNKSHNLATVAIDEYIDINPSFKAGHVGWKHGQIIKLDANSSQVKVLYFLNNENHSIWIHLENTAEAAPFNSKYDPLQDHIPQLFNEYRDVHPLKRFTSIDVIDNNYYQNMKPQKQPIQQQEQDSIHQLINFGYGRNQIISAMQLAKDKSDINEIIECIEQQEQKRNQGKQQQNQQQQQKQSQPVSSSHHEVHISAMNMNGMNGMNELEIDYNMIIDDDKDDDVPMNVMQGLQVGVNRPQDFDKQLSSMAFGIDLMMDDIIDQMEMGDDGQNSDEDGIDDVHSTPMGPTSMGPKPNNKNMVLAEGGQGAVNGEGYHGNNPLMEGIDDKNAKPVPLQILPMDMKQNNYQKAKRYKNAKSPKSPILKWKKFVQKNKNKNDKNKNRVFGIDPRNLSSTLVLERDYASPIPNLLIKLRQQLFGKNGHLIEGIFRIAPNRDQCKVVEQQLNDGKLMSIKFGSVEADIIANLIKLWFRQMPNTICQSLVGKNKIESCNNIQTVNKIVNNDMVEPNKSYFLWLLDLCNDIIAHMYVNKMSAKAMAVVIAPNLYDPDKFGDPMLAMTFSAKLIRFVQFAIEWRQQK